MEKLKRQVHNIGRQRAWAIWAAGMSVYILAIFHRTSLGVAGLVAAERFHISAAQLSTFTVLQLAVYAGMQVPVGVLLDRYGSKVMMTSGLIMMTGGQLWFAFASSFGMGLGARALVGAGDAMIFVSLIRLVALWFPVRRAPLLTQMTSMFGQIGAVAAATPLAAALREWGWTRTFGAAASLGVVFGILLGFVVKDSPYRSSAVETVKLGMLAGTLKDVWGNPGTRLGFYSHFTAQFSAVVFTLLWGYPFLVKGEGLSSDTAANLLILMVAATVVSGPLVARFVSRHPYYRSSIVLVIVAAITLVWAVVLLWPGRAPLPVLMVLVSVVAVGGPGSMVGFDLARSFHREHRLGRATGIVNAGSFVASLLTMAMIGILLDRLAPRGPDTYTLNDFRVVMSVQFLFWGFGAAQIWRYRRKSLRFLASVPGALQALKRGETILPGLSRDLEA